MASAQKCGGVQKNISANSVTGAQLKVALTESVTEDQPISTGMAPAAPPTTMFWLELRLSQSV